MTAVIWPHRASPLDRSQQQSPFESKPQRPATAPTTAAVGGRTIRIIMAGGGTGGHLYPGLAVAEALREKLGPQLELTWAATPRAVDQHLLSGFGQNYIQQPVQPLVKSVTRLWGFWQAWRQSCAFWQNFLAEHHVDAILALGGYAAGPAAYTGANHGIPVGLLNPDALPGLANRFLLKRADRVFSQWPLPATFAKNIRARVLPLGCPIRPSLLSRDRARAAERLSLNPARPTLVICGGSLAAKTINDALIALLQDTDVRAALRSGPNPWQIIHLSGKEQVTAVKAAYEPIIGIAAKVLDYCDDMASVWALADLALARAGASTCAELTACGVPSILLPYPYHRDQHQRHNAQQLVDAGAALLIEDTKETTSNAQNMKKPLLSLLSDASARSRMAVQAKQAGKPNAAAAIADELLALIRSMPHGS